ncbi:MAG: hypothetical protein AB7L09_01310 [Nitrospira sp.]
MLLHYLVDGKPVGGIADDLGVDRADVRAQLKDGGIILRPSANGYALGRDPVCDSVRRLGFSSFHDYAQVHGLDPITEQASSLGVSERSLARVYSAYRSLLTSLKADGIGFPTTQRGCENLEQRRTPD